MQDEDKSKQQLITELHELRNRVAESERDNEERKRMEEELLEPQRMLQSVLDTIPVRVFWKDLDSNYLGCNRPFALDAGLQSPEEIIGRNDFEIGWAEQAGLYISDDRWVMETGIAKLGYEEPQTTPSGDTIWLRTSKVPLFDLKGEIKGVLGTYEDITTRKLAEDALKLSERRLKRAELVALFGNWEFILGLDKVKASEGARIIYGLEGAEWSISEVQTIPLPEYRGMLDKALNGLVEEGKRYNVEFKIRRPTDGKIIDIHSIAEYSPEKGVVFGVIQDITERKRAEEEIRRTNAYLENIFDNLPDVIGIVDKHGRFIRWNKMVAEIYGYTFEEMKGKSAFDLYADEDELEKMLVSLRREGTIKKWEMRMERKDGSIAPFEISIGLLKDSQNETLGSVGVASDLTGIKEAFAALRASHDRLNQEIIERKRAEEKLTESEQLSRNIIHGSPIPAFVIGQDHKVLYWNTALEELTRIKAEEIIGTTNHWTAFYSSERPCMADLLVDQALDAIPQWYSNKYIKSRLIEEAYEVTDYFPELGDRGKWLRFTTAVIRDSLGDLVGAIETLEDVTGRKLTEQALRNSELRLQSVIQGSPIPTFVIGKDHRIIYWNKALEELSGIKSEEVIGTTDCYRAFYSEKRPVLADLMVDQALEAIPRWYFEKYTKSTLLDEAYEATDFFSELQGGGKWVRFTAAVIRDSRGDLVGAVETLEDVTERKRAEEQLIMIKKLESLGVFADGIAHEFNKLLSIMLRNIFAAKLSLADEQPGLWGEGLEIAERAGLQAKELAHRLVTFAKGGEPIRKIGSISQLLMDSVDLSLSGSNVICEFSLPGDLWLIEMDDVQIRQVINTLVVNAREAMSEGGTITIDAENVNVTAGCGLPLKEGKYVKLSVKDHGIGIPQENLQRILDPYFTTKSTTAARGKGLGLAICYSIVKRHDGFIGVKSEPGVGSTFFVYLPASPQGTSIKKVMTNQGDTRGGGILLMDDEETVRNATGIVLNYLGYNVEYAKDGKEAIDLYRTAKEKGWPFSAVILDLYVPGGMGGKEAMRELLAIDPYIRAIVSSKYSDDPVVSEFRKHGFFGAVDVPYDVEKMKKILSNLPPQENLID